MSFSNLFGSRKIAKTTEGQSENKIEPANEVTEEGFILVGRSSFFMAEDQQQLPPVPPQNPLNLGLGPAYNLNFNVDTPSYRPYMGQTTHVGAGSSLDSSDSDIIKSILVLHSNLKPNVEIYDPKVINRIVNYANYVDLTEFEYDFDFERGVLRETT